MVREHRGCLGFAIVCTAMLLTGCATSRQARWEQRRRDEQLTMVQHLYELGRVKSDVYYEYSPSSPETKAMAETYAGVTGTVERALLTMGTLGRPVVEERPAAEITEACERLLLLMSEHEDTVVAAAAGSCLARFGTGSAVRRALELARQSPWAVIRGETLMGIADVLSEAEGDRELAPCTWMNRTPEPQYLRIPVGVSRQEIERVVVEAFLTDDGEYLYPQYTKIPLVPFSGRVRKSPRSIRKRLAWEIALSHVLEEEASVKAIQDARHHQDPAVRRYVAGILEQWGELPDSTTPTDGSAHD